jgi:signal transduction histidine kinase
LPITAILAASFGTSTILLSLLDWHRDAPIATGLLVAASAGVVAALNHRWITALVASGLILRIFVLSFAGRWQTEVAPILLLLPPIVLLAVAMLRPLAWVRFPTWLWAVFPVSAVVIIMAAQSISPESMGWFILLPTGATLASFAGFAAARHIGRGNVVGSARYALGDRRWLTEMARTLLLGRISSDLSHELSQSLNVITMANGNLGYILGRAEIAEPHGQQLAERVRRIAGNAESAAQVLGQFRWFGQDGGREGDDLSVGSALNNAVAATRAAARKSGVAIEVRGDALTHSLPLRHGTIEMMATVALLEIVQMLTARPIDSPPPERIMLEATKNETHIEISILCDSALGTRPAGDDIAQATYELLSKLALSCHCELHRVNRRSDPVHFILRLDRDMV